MPNNRLPTNFCGKGKPSNFTTVIEAKRLKFGPDKECPKIAFDYMCLSITWAKVQVLSYRFVYPCQYLRSSL